MSLGGPPPVYIGRRVEIKVAVPEEHGCGIGLPEEEAGALVAIEGRQRRPVGPGQQRGNSLNEVAGGTVVGRRHAPHAVVRSGLGGSRKGPEVRHGDRWHVTAGDHRTVHVPPCWHGQGGDGRGDRGAHAPFPVLIINTDNRQ